MGIPSRFGQIQADQFLGSQADASPFGKIWYVDSTNGTDGNSGEAPDEAKSSVAGVIAVMKGSRGDTAVFAPGTYTVTAALVPLSYTTFKAAVIDKYHPTVKISGNIAALVTVDVSGCRFIGIEFKATGTAVRDLVKIADTASVNGVSFKHCIFDGANTLTGNLHNGVCGVWATDATYTVSDLGIGYCLFRNCGKTNLDIGIKGIPYATIENNVFAIATPAGIGINLRDTGVYGVGKGYVIKENEFIGPSATTPTTIGIVIAGTVNATGAGMIRNNCFYYCATAPITQNELTQAAINNYRAEGNGGSLVDVTA